MTRPDMHQIDTDQGGDHQRRADDIDALIWLGKWAGIALLVVTAGWLAWHIPAAWFGRV